MSNQSFFFAFFSYCAGGTPLGMYKRLISYYQQGKISFKYVKTFNMDEYVDLPRDHPESYHYYMYNNFFKHIDINPENVHILDGNAPDLEKECNDFEKKINEAGGIELFIGGTLVILLNVKTTNFFLIATSVCRKKSVRFF